MGLEGSGAFGTVGIGTWAVLSRIPEGACACGAEGHMASIGPLALGAKGCVERLHRFAQEAMSIIMFLSDVKPLPAASAGNDSVREISRLCSK